MGPKGLAKQITSYSDEMQSCLNKAHYKLSEKSVHSLRITIRRIRAIFWIVRHCENGPRLKTSDQRLRKLTRALGKIRELDVAIKDAKSYYIQNDELKRRRDEISRAPSKALSKRGFNRIRKQLIADSKKIANSKRLKLTDSYRRLRKQIQKWEERKAYHKSDLHRLRILVKRTRYSLDALGTPIHQLADLQDKLGKMHDLEVLVCLLGRHAPVAKTLCSLKLEVESLIPSTLAYTARKLRNQYRP